jgi:hypothetical protein
MLQKKKHLFESKQKNKWEKNFFLPLANSAKVLPFLPKRFWDKRRKKRLTNSSCFCTLQHWFKKFVSFFSFLNCLLFVEKVFSLIREVTF